jgi:Cys-rich four helix bundle protein (predicted Tat secretion target)
MERRDILLGALSLSALAATTKAFAEDHSAHMQAMGMDGMHHHSSARKDKLIAVAADCVAKANICLQHCLVLLGQGQTNMAECAKSSSQVIALCTALEQLAAAESQYLSQLAKVAMAACKDCAEECKKTESHPECKACKEACEVCYKECQKIAA